MTSKDKLGMSLDDIIQLDRKRGGNRGRGRGRINVRGRGGRGRINVRGRGGRGGPAARGRQGSIARGRGGTSMRGRGRINIRGPRRSMSRDRGGTNSRGRVGTNIRARGGRNQGRPIIIRRGQKGLRGRFRGNQGMTNSFRSDHIIRQQALQQKLNRVRSLKQTMSNNAVSGASDMLTVCITNDLATRRRRRSRSVPRTGSVNNIARDSFVRRGNSNMYLNRQSLDRLNTSMDSSSIVVSSEGSVRRRGRASSVGRNRNRRSSSVGRDGFQGQNEAIIDQYVPISTWQPRSGLNMQLQKEIAAIQGKPYLPPSPTGFPNGSIVGLSLSDFRPVPTLTGTTLNERFS